jgi:hypothetical protein
MEDVVDRVDTGGASLGGADDLGTPEATELTAPGSALPRRSARCSWLEYLRI